MSIQSFLCGALAFSSGCMATGTNTTGTVIETSTSATSASTIIISPSTQTVSPGAILPFSVSGGTPPYTYSVMSGGGTIGATTGLYTAPSASMTSPSVEVSVKDAQGDYAYATLNISSSSISLTAATATVAAGGTDQMSASGGSGSYSYAVVSGGGTIGASSGLYTAPSTVGSVEISVEDATGAIAYDIISVGAGSSGGTSTSAVHAFTSAASNSVLTGWPANNVLADSSASYYSSAVFATVSPSTPPVLEAWFNGPTTISQVNLLARMSGNLSLAYPILYQLYVTDPADSTWIMIGNYNAQPGTNGKVTIQLPQSYSTYGVMIVASALGVDNLGNHYFQLCGLSAQ